jgi:tripeptidyl-peptidase-1
LLQPNLFYRPTQAGKKQLGFLNPWLYANPDVLTDITVGTNAISRAGTPFKYGYNCTSGWDPATGLGTPVFSKLLAAALSLP